MDVYGHLYDEAQVEIADKLDAFHARAIADAAPPAEVIALNR